jgi:large subunit ribosomal protein L32
MPNPRNKHSKQRTRTRRAHHRAAVPQIAKCQATGEAHVYHHAYYDEEGNMRYRGKVLVKSKSAEE